MSFRSWIELESDPGLFSLLMYDFGVKGVEVEEVYDLSKPIERSVYGFIFLFKWTEERKTRRKAAVPEENFVLDEAIENDMFFAQQIIPNSCASHALLSVLLNVQDVSLGYTLKQLRDSCKGFDPESKGFAIGNFWNIAVAHNNHGRPELRCHADRSKNVTASRSMEAFHYVSYIPYRDRLFELDGLKPHPIDHGPWRSDETWSDKARKVIQDRIARATGGELAHDIRYNLLAVVPEQRETFKEKMEILDHNKKVLIEIFKRLACKERFVVETPTNSILKQTDTHHPFPERKLLTRKRKGGGGKTVSFHDGGPLSPNSHSSSTLTGNESERRFMSDSEDESINTYRIKSIMRGKSPVVYVYGEEITEPEDKSTDLNEQTTDQKEQSANQKESSKNEIETAKKLKLDVDEISNNSSNDTKPDGNIKLEENTDTVTKQNKSECSESTENIKNTEKTQDKDDSQKTFDSITLDSKTEKKKNTDLELSSKDNTGCTKSGNTEEISATEDEIQSKDIKQESVQPGIGVEIVADDVDIQALLEQKNIKKLSLEHVLKYENRITLPDLQRCMQDLDEYYNAYQTSHKEELEKLERYKIDDCRRRHNYEPFVATFLSMLAEQGHLTRLLEQQNHANNMKKLAKAAFQKKEAANRKRRKVRRK